MFMQLVSEELQALNAKLLKDFCADGTSRGSTPIQAPPSTRGAPLINALHERRRQRGRCRRRWRRSNGMKATCTTACHQAFGAQSASWATHYCVLKCETRFAGACILVQRRQHLGAARCCADGFAKCTYVQIFAVPGASGHALPLRQLFMHNCSTHGSHVPACKSCMTGNKAILQSMNLTRLTMTNDKTVVNVRPLPSFTICLQLQCTKCFARHGYELA